MIAAGQAIQRRPDARLLVIDAQGRLQHAPRRRLIDFLRRGDIVIADNAATPPASLRGRHLRTGAEIEVRLAGRGSLNSSDFAQFSAIVFGEGDHPTPTENRPAPPALVAGDRLALGPLTATVEEILGRPRLFSLRFDGPPDAVWAGPARHGRPIQYSHIEAPLTLWEVHIEALRMTGRSIPTGVLPRGASECKAKGLPARRGTPI